MRILRNLWRMIGLAPMAKHRRLVMELDQYRIRAIQDRAHIETLKARLMAAEYYIQSQSGTRVPQGEADGTDL